MLSSSFYTATSNSASICITMSTGKRLGVLTCVNFAGDTIHKEDFFFSLSDDDIVANSLLEIKSTKDGLLQVNIPVNLKEVNLKEVCNRFGVTRKTMDLFLKTIVKLQHQTIAEGLNDASILRLLARSDNNDTVDLMFKRLHERIQRTALQRVAFKKLYYRVFRKSFAPSGSQGRKIIKAWDDGSVICTEQEHVRN